MFMEVLGVVAGLFVLCVACVLLAVGSSGFLPAPFKGVFTGCHEYPSHF